MAIFSDVIFTHHGENEASLSIPQHEEKAKTSRRHQHFVAKHSIDPRGFDRRDCLPNGHFALSRLSFTSSLKQL